MVLLILMILHLIVTVLLIFLLLHIPLNQILLSISKLFILVKRSVRELIFFQSKWILVIIFTKTKSINRIIYLGEIINGNVNVICYDLKDIVPLSLRSISQNYRNKLQPQHIPMAEHDNVMDEKTMRKSIEFKI